MVTDEQLMQQMRAGMRAATADVHVPPGLLDGISPSSRRRRRPRMWLPGASTLALAGAMAVPLAIAGLAIVLLGHRGSPVSVRPARPTVTRHYQLPATTAELRSQLAILRRAQRPTDRVPPWAIAAEERPQAANGLTVSQVQRSSTRLLKTLRLPVNGEGLGRRERVYLVLGSMPTFRGASSETGWNQTARTRRGPHLTLIGLTRKDGANGGIYNLLPNYLPQQPMPAAVLTPRDVLITGSGTVGVVPDGVVRVRWMLTNPTQTRPKSVTATVHDNVAVAPPTPSPRGGNPTVEAVLAGADWYDAAGRVIASFRDTTAELRHSQF
jgi:hypothetical protein